MKKFMKNFIAIVLTVALVLGMLPLSEAPIMLSQESGSAEEQDKNEVAYVSDVTKASEVDSEEELVRDEVVVSQEKSDEVEKDQANNVDKTNDVDKEDDEITYEAEITGAIDGSSEEWPDSDELYEGYLDELFFASTDGIERSNYGASAYNGLGDLGKAFYEELKTGITKIANGETSSTVILISSETMNKLSLAYGSADNVYTDIVSFFRNKVEIDKLYYALLVDCPYELYWHMKSKGYRVSYNTQNVNGTIAFSRIAVSLYVGSDYAVKNGNSYKDFEVDSTNVNRAKAAKTKADEIIAKYAYSDDYDKLYGYLKEICALTNYNYTAAAQVSDSSRTVIDPWQLVYVFDGDSSTNVVCEGYAKAFQYLVDQSAFQNDIKSDIVTGTMVSKSGSSISHMWNVVMMEDGKNYLVDITNCDSNSDAFSDRLFLAGLSGTVSAGYTFGSYTYKYNEKSIALYGESRLTLASSNYQKSVQPKIEVNNTIVYDGNPLEAGIDFQVDLKGLTGTVSYSYKRAGQTTYVTGLPTNAGTYTLRVNVAGNAQNSYTSASAEKEITIVPKGVTVTVMDRQIYVNDALPSLANPVKDIDYSVSGLVANDTLSGNLTLVYTDANGKNVTPDTAKEGSYVIAASGLYHDNYQINYVKGTLEIVENPAAPDESGSNPSGGSTPDENTPEVNKPDENTSEVDKPDENTSEVDKPDENTPEVDKPDENTSEENKPDENTPDENTPEENKPDENTPEENKPDENTSEVDKPDENTSEVDKPDENTSEVDKPDENTPGVDKSDENTPEVDKKDENTSEVDKKDENTSEVDKPDENTPEENKPDESTKDPVKNDETETKINTTEEISFTDTQTNTVVSVVVTKAPDGEIIFAEATVIGKGTELNSGTKIQISRSVIAKIVEAAGTENVPITVKVVDQQGQTVYEIEVNAKDVKAGNTLYLFGYNSNTNSYTIIYDNEYKMTKNGDISITATKGTYKLVNLLDARSIMNEIIRSLLRH